MSEDIYQSLQAAHLLYMLAYATRTWGPSLNHRWNGKSPHVPIHARGRQIGAKVPELHVPPPTKAPQSGEKMPDLLYLPLHVPLLAKAPQSGERVLDLLNLFLRVPTLPRAPRNGERVRNYENQNGVLTEFIWHVIASEHA